MAAHPLVERIMTEPVCMAEIHEWCATRLMNWIKDTDRHHTAEECTSSNKKNCSHAPGEGELELAIDHINTMPHVCTCGLHA